MRTALRVVLLLFIFSFSAFSVETDPSCLRSLTAQASRWQRVQNWIPVLKNRNKNINWDQYEQLVIQYENELPLESSLNTLEKKLAYIQVSSRTINVNWTSTSDFQGFLRKLDSIEFAEGVSFYEVDKLFRSLYGGSYNRRTSVLRGFSPEEKDELITLTIHQEISSFGLKKFLTDRGLVKGNSNWENFLSFWNSRYGAAFKFFIFNGPIFFTAPYPIPLYYPVRRVSLFSTKQTEDLLTLPLRDAKASIASRVARVTNRNILQRRLNTGLTYTLMGAAVVYGVWNYFKIREERAQQEEKADLAATELFNGFQGSIEELSQEVSFINSKCYDLQRAVNLYYPTYKKQLTEEVLMQIERDLGVTASECTSSYLSEN